MQKKKNQKKCHDANTTEHNGNTSLSLFCVIRGVSVHYMVLVFMSVSFDVTHVLLLPCYVHFNRIKQLLLQQSQIQDEN